MKPLKSINWLISLSLVFVFLFVISSSALAATSVSYTDWTYLKTSTYNRTSKYCKSVVYNGVTSVSGYTKTTKQWKDASTMGVHTCIVKYYSRYKKEVTTPTTHKPTVKTCKYNGKTVDHLGAVDVQYRNNTSSCYKQFRVVLCSSTTGKISYGKWVNQSKLPASACGVKKPTPTPKKPNNPGNGGTTPSNPTTPEKPSTSGLKNGSRGTAVKTLQKNLNTVGKYGLDVDGIFGPKTEKALKDFQKDHKLKVNGIYDSATQKAMAAALKPATKPAPKSAVPTVSALYPKEKQIIQIKPGENDGKLATVQFAGSGKTTPTTDPVLLQILYRKVSDVSIQPVGTVAPAPSRWMSFGTAAVPSPDGSMSTPNGRLNAKFVNKYGWSCMMGWGKVTPPADCNTVWTNGSKKGKSAFSGYKVYEPTVLLEPGVYEYVARTYDNASKKYSTTFSKKITFTVKLPQTVKGFETTKTALGKNATYAKLLEYAKKYHMGIVLGDNGTLTLKPSIIAVPFIDEKQSSQPQPVSGISTQPIGSDTSQSPLNDGGSSEGDADAAAPPVNTGE